MKATFMNLMFGAALALGLVLATWGQQTTKPAAPPPAAKQAATADPEDEEIARLKLEQQRLKKLQEIEILKRENAQLAGAQEEQGQTPPAKPLTAEQEQLKALEAERERLLTEQKVETLRKQNEALRGGPVASPAPAPQAPAAKPCTPQSGPKLTASVPKNPSAWMCKTLGICADTSKPVTVIGADGCPSTPGPTPANRPATPPNK
jgi:hypothetical protein